MTLNKILKSSTIIYPNNSSTRGYWLGPKRGVSLEGTGLLRGGLPQLNLRSKDEILLENRTRQAKNLDWEIQDFGWKLNQHRRELNIFTMDLESHRQRLKKLRQKVNEFGQRVDEFSQRVEKLHLSVDKCLQKKKEFLEELRLLNEKDSPGKNNFLQK